MKTTLTIFAFLIVWGSATAAPPLAEQLQGVDVVGIITVTNVNKTSSTNAAGQVTAAFIADARVEQILKGAPQKEIRVRDEAQTSRLAADDLYRPAGAPLKSKAWYLGTSRFLVFLKRSGDAYVPATGLDGLSPIWGNGLGTDRVTCFGCTTIDETIALIKKALPK
jgi:hypothetical protein